MDRSVRMFGQDRMEVTHETCYCTGGLNGSGRIRFATAPTRQNQRTCLASQNLPALPAAAVENSDREPVSNLVKTVNILGICLPFAGLIVAVVSLWGHGFSWLHMSLLLGMYVVSALGITVGYHRL